MANIHSQAGLPGAELVERGIEDLAAGRETEEALLVEIAAPRLRSLGVSLEARADGSCQSPEHRLYGLLSAEPDAHSRYNALLARIASYARAAEHVRPPVDRERLQALADKLGRVAQERTIVYLTGGATAVLEGWRGSTVDVDIRFDPDSDALLRVLPALKEELRINVELASPPDFIPELPGWRDRSPVVFEAGNVQVRHFDPYSQALSKIERGFSQDLEDVKKMLEGGLVEPGRLLELYEQIEPDLYRYPAIDPAAFRGKVRRAVDDVIP